MEAIRVLHSVTSYLNLTENWIEPQVFRVPGASGRVLCEGRANIQAFDPGPGNVIVDVPPSGWHWRVERYLKAFRRHRGVGRAARREVRGWRPHLVHGHFGQRGWESIHLARRLAVPLVTSFYGYDAWMAPRVDPIWLGRYRELFSEGAVFLVEGPAMRDRLVALHCPVEKIRVHRIGVNLAGLPFVEREFAGPMSVAMVGRFVEKKGLVDGLRACALARSRGIDLDVTIVGDATADDPAGERIRAELHALAAGPELAGRVRFTGFISAEETSAVLRTHDVFLCPSRHAASGDAEGGSPVVLTESMAMGAFCIGTRHCDIPEVILDGRTGVLCPEGDIDGLADALCAVPDRPAEVRHMTREGRRHVESAFAIDAQLKALGQVYRSLS